MQEVVEENGIDKHIRYNHKVSTASWSSETNLWTVKAQDTKAGSELEFTCNFLYMCAYLNGFAACDLGPLTDLIASGRQMLFQCVPTFRPGLLQSHDAVPTRMGGHEGLQGSHCPPADLAREPRLQEQERCRHWLGRHRCYRRSQHGRRRQAHHHAPAFAHCT